MTMIYNLPFLMHFFSNGHKWEIAYNYQSFTALFFLANLKLWQRWKSFFCEFWDSPNFLKNNLWKRLLYMSAISYHSCTWMGWILGWMTESGWIRNWMSWIIKCWMIDENKRIIQCEISTREPEKKLRIF